MSSDARHVDIKLEMLETEIDRVVWERETLQSEADPKQFASLQEQLGSAESKANRLTLELAQERVDQEDTKIALAAYESRCARFEEMLELLGVSQFAIKYALMSVSAEQALKAAGMSLQC
jgi:t-SNARE complex subunit (syntaxin)